MPEPKGFFENLASIFRVGDVSNPNARNEALIAGSRVFGPRGLGIKPCLLYTSDAADEN